MRCPSIVSIVAICVCWADFVLAQTSNILPADVVVDPTPQAPIIAPTVEVTCNIREALSKKLAFNQMKDDAGNAIEGTVVEVEAKTCKYLFDTSAERHIFVLPTSITAVANAETAEFCPKLATAILMRLSSETPDFPWLGTTMTLRREKLFSSENRTETGHSLRDIQISKFYDTSVSGTLSFASYFFTNFEIYSEVDSAAEEPGSFSEAVVIATPLEGKAEGTIDKKIVIDLDILAIRAVCMDNNRALLNVLQEI